MEMRWVECFLCHGAGEEVTSTGTHCPCRRCGREGGWHEILRTCPECGQDFWYEKDRLPDIPECDDCGRAFLRGE
jgi:ribosomal protein L37E